MVERPNICLGGARPPKELKAGSVDKHQVPYRDRDVRQSVVTSLSRKNRKLRPETRPEGANHGDKLGPRSQPTLENALTESGARGGNGRSVSDSLAPQLNRESDNAVNCTEVQLVHKNRTDLRVQRWVQYDNSSRHTRICSSTWSIDGAADFTCFEICSGTVCVSIVIKCVEVSKCRIVG